MNYPPVSLEISLLQTGGEVLNAGNLELVCDFRATHISGTPMDSGRVSLLAKDRISQRWVEYRRETDRKFGEEMYWLAKHLGLPERMPKVRGTIDTCDSWTQLLFRVKADGVSRAFTIDVQCRGFEGSEAETLRELLQKLFLAAGFESHSRSVYGFD